MKSVIFLIDFDRTITFNDSTDEIMKIHNEALVEEYQAKFSLGKLRVRDYIKGLLESLKLTREEYRYDVSRNVIVDECFKEFLKLNYEVRIVSAGTYDNVLGVFAKNGISIPEERIYSNRLEFEGKDIRITFPHDNNESYEGICKKSVVMKYKKLYDKVVFIGDGHSDIPASSAADILFAKKGLSLEKYCIDNSIKYIPYSNFCDIIKAIDEGILDSF
jgi:2,3-diketo-5-methylthio-1-phosphopentane phosphatase